MTTKLILCRKGDACPFVVKGMGPINARYDRARFQVREAWDLSRPVLLSADETNGITIDYDNQEVRIVLGAVQTRTLAITAPKKAAAQLRLFNSSDPDDCLSWPIEFLLHPTAVNNV